jgi:hypothetical protein
MILSWHTKNGVTTYFWGSMPVSYYLNSREHELLQHVYILSENKLRYNTCKFSSHLRQLKRYAASVGTLMYNIYKLYLGSKLSKCRQLTRK